MKPTLMLIGLGHLGGVLLELFARESWLGRIAACSRDRERGAARCNLARLGALAQGHAARIDHVPLDVENGDAVAEAIRREVPDLILCAASMQTWWLAERLPPAAAAPLRRARFGLWLPVHLAPTLALMRALRASRYDGITLTAPFPDVVNVILARLDLAPTCGVGNVAEVASKVELLAARRLGAAPESMTVTLVAHHALEAFAYGGSEGDAPPFFLRVDHGGRDVTREIGAQDLLLAGYPLPSGPAAAFLTAGAAVRLARAVLAPGEERLHAPAPGGLPGGYPVLAGRGRVRPAPIDGLALDGAIAINERSHPYDGIERIEADGTAVFCEATREAAREALGYDAAPLKPDESRERGTEIMARFTEYALRHGLDLESPGAAARG